MSGSVADLIDTGIAMGIIHVLTGPDHLSALATLSGTSISSRKRLDAFLLGIRWGVGHSVGILVVGGAMIAVEESSSEWIAMDQTFRFIMEILVGVFMLALGSFGVCQAYQNRRIAAEAPLSDSISQGHFGIGKPALSESAKHRRDSMEIVAQMSEALNRDGDSIRLRRGGGSFLPQDDDVDERIFNAVSSLRNNADSAGEGDDDTLSRSFVSMIESKPGEVMDLSRSFVNILQSKPPPMKASSMVQKHATPDNSIVNVPAPNDPPASFIGRTCRSCTPGALALIAGLVQGAAGPGGALGVVPAVQLRDARLAMVYLGTFCLTSAIVMGGFAAFYGRFAEWMVVCSGRDRGGPSSPAARVFYVEFGSAFLSIAVGIAWLVLLSAGRLDEVFP